MPRNTNKQTDLLLTHIYMNRKYFQLIFIGVKLLLFKIFSLKTAKNVDVKSYQILYAYLFISGDLFFFVFLLFLLKIKKKNFYNKQYSLGGEVAARLINTEFTFTNFKREKKKELIK